jgi:hypothetical protein
MMRLRLRYLDALLGLSTVLLDICFMFQRWAHRLHRYVENRVHPMKGEGD